MTRAEIRNEMVDIVIKYKTVDESEKADLMDRLHELVHMYIDGNYEEDSK